MRARHEANPTPFPLISPLQVTWYEDVHLWSWKFAVTVSPSIIHNLTNSVPISRRFIRARVLCRELSVPFKQFSRWSGLRHADSGPRDSEVRGQEDSSCGREHSLCVSLEECACYAKDSCLMCVCFSTSIVATSCLCHWVDILQATPSNLCTYMFPNYSHAVQT